MLIIKDLFIKGICLALYPAELFGCNEFSYEVYEWQYSFHTDFNKVAL